MSLRCHSLLSVFGLLLVLAAFLLQLLTLTTTWWAAFSARTDLGKPKEDGHYGLWTLCNTKGPHWTEDCDPLDTFFQLPSFLQVAGIIGIIHLLMLLSLVPLESLWAIERIKNAPGLCLKPKTLCITKISVAFISVIFAILVAIFASVGENRQAEYTVRKEWSFWIQLSVIAVDIIITLVCAIENLRFWQQHIRQNVDPEGTWAETYANPTFDSEPVEFSHQRQRHSSNGAVAYTESSGHPYGFNSNPTSNSGSKKSGKKGKSNREEMVSTTLVYENECYQEHSPSARRMRRSNH
ncbi:uncharacterized protein LOC129958393 [Argiope bruennichi]|uniref:uncharacterized protein LOC129958393 n=1 Tax=Argiope bruennichi TaxID=94029 RepID=UPI00249554D7|nr:uncharacterized protein LOC129958393 [Argiope bruennichi]